jgi:Mn2+/Fe2+ NRAMP family transporter
VSAVRIETRDATPEMVSGSATFPVHRSRVWIGLLAVLGPGLMVMLGDSDVGSIVTAAQSGAQWGYRLLPLELLLIPVLYLVMELTARLGIATGKGHAELIKERFGARWAALSVATLVVTALGALVTEFAGIAGVASLVGVPPQAAVPAAAALLALVVVSGTYRRVELIGIGLGLFELAFLGAAIHAHVDPRSLATSLWAGQPLGNSAYLAIVEANVGAVVMPWMIFYQQAATVDKGLTPHHLRAARLDTATGAVVTQLVMIAVLVLTGATLFNSRSGSLHSIPQISAALTPFLGAPAGRLAFALGTTGAALVGAIVVSLATSWAFAELAGKPRSLNLSVRRAPLFYGVYFGALLLAAMLVLTSASLVRLAIDVEILNALLLPIALGFLVALAWTALPRRFRLRPWERGALIAVTTMVVGAGLALAAATLA